MPVETQAKNSGTEPTAAPAPKTDKAAKSKASAKKVAQPKAETAKAAKPTVPAPKAAPAAAKVAEPKAAPKTAVAKPKPASSDRRSAYDNASVIRVIDLSRCELKGKRGAAVKALRDNMTVEQFKAALLKTKVARLETYVGWALTTAIAAKAISVKG